MEGGSRKWSGSRKGSGLGAWGPWSAGQGMKGARSRGERRSEEGAREASSRWQRLRCTVAPEAPLSDGAAGGSPAFGGQLTVSGRAATVLAARAEDGGNGRKRSAQREVYLPLSAPEATRDGATEGSRPEGVMEVGALRATDRAKAQKAHPPTSRAGGTRADKKSTERQRGRRGRGRPRPP